MHDLEDPKPMRLRIVAVLALALGVLVVVFPDTYRSWRLAREGERAIGSVLESTPDQHQLVRYSFIANGEHVEGSDNSCTVRNGLVTVWFAKSDPTISVCDQRGTWWHGALFGLLLLTLGAPILWFGVGMSSRGFGQPKKW
jgi:Protein of unknown function (DUF3592)